MRTRPRRASTGLWVLVVSVLAGCSGKESNPGEGTGAGGAAGCLGLEQPCNGTCVALASDNLNCGACGRACQAPQACAAGVCDCPAGSLACGALCVNVSSD